jgi:hypothetical protein
MSRAKEAIRRFLETINKNVKVTSEKDDFLSLEGTLKDVDIERPIKGLRRKWKK